jgi:hypothetical protein
MMSYESAWDEHCRHELNARYDDVRERFASEIRDYELECMALDEQFAAERRAQFHHEELHWSALLTDPRAAPRLPT